MRYVKSLKPAWQSSKFCLQHILVPGYFASLPTLRNHGKLEFFVHFKPCSFSLPVQQTEKNFDWGSWKCVGRLEFLWFSDPSPFVGWGRTGEDGRMDSLSHLKSLCLIWGMPCPSNSSCELQSFKSQVAFLWHFYFFFLKLLNCFSFKVFSKCRCILSVRGTAFWDSWFWFSTKAFSGVQREDTRQGRNVSGWFVVVVSNFGAKSEHVCKIHRSQQ